MILKWKDICAIAVTTLSNASMPILILYITKAMDYFDLSGENFMPGMKKTAVRFLVISFKSDWLYPAHQSQDIVRLLKRKHAYTTYFDLNLHLRPRRFFD